MINGLNINHKTNDAHDTMKCKHLGTTRHGNIIYISLLSFTIFKSYLVLRKKYFLIHCN